MPLAWEFLELFSDQGEVEGQSSKHWRRGYKPFATFRLISLIEGARNGLDLGLLLGPLVKLHWTRNCLLPGSLVSRRFLLTLNLGGVGK